MSSRLIEPTAPVADLPTYVAGRSASGGDSAKLSSNELPYDPLPRVVAAVERALTTVNRYPSARGDDLREAVAAHVGVHGREVAVGPGSSGLLWQLVSAYLAPGDRVVLHAPNFEAYPIAIALARAEAVAVPMAEWHSDVDALAAAVDDRTKLVILVDPHNPTGTTVGADATRRLIEQVDGRALVLLDQAYIDFDSDPVGQVPWWREHANVVVLRTFSKAHGLAALRVGYALARPEVVANLGAVAPPFTVSQLAIAAATASLAARADLAERVARVAGERQRITAALRARGIPVPPSRANFVFLPADAVPPGLDAACDARGVLIRAIGSYGVRVSIGTAEENDRFLDAVEACAGAR